jgi:hypothetical protein
MRTRQSNRTARDTAAVMLAASLAFFLAGCGSGGDNPSNAPSKPQPAATAQGGSSNTRTILRAFRGLVYTVRLIANTRAH